MACVKVTHVRMVVNLALLEDEILQNARGDYFRYVYTERFRDISLAEFKNNQASLEAVKAMNLSFELTKWPV